MNNKKTVGKYHTTLHVNQIGPTVSGGKSINSASAVALLPVKETHETPTVRHSIITGNPQTKQFIQSQDNLGSSHSAKNSDQQKIDVHQLLSSVNVGQSKRDLNLQALAQVQQRTREGNKNSHSVKQASVELQQGVSPQPQQSGGISTDQDQQKVSFDSNYQKQQRNNDDILKDSLCVESTEELFQDQNVKFTGSSVDSHQQVKITQKTHQQTLKKNFASMIGPNINSQTKLMQPKDTNNEQYVKNYHSQKMSQSELIPASLQNATTTQIRIHQPAKLEATTGQPKLATYRATDLFAPPNSSKLTGGGITPQAQSTFKSKVQISMQGKSTYELITSNPQKLQSSGGDSPAVFCSTAKKGKSNLKPPTINSIGNEEQLKNLQSEYQQVKQKTVSTQNMQQQQQLKRSNPKAVVTAYHKKGSVQFQKRSDTAQTSSQSEDGVAENYLTTKQSSANTLPQTVQKRYTAGHQSPTHQFSEPTSEAQRSNTSDTEQKSKFIQTKERNQSQVILEYLKKKPASAKKDPTKNPKYSLQQTNYQESHKRISSLNSNKEKKQSSIPKQKPTNIVKSILIQSRGSFSDHEPIEQIVTMTTKQKYSKTFHNSTSGPVSLITAQSTKNSALQSIFTQVHAKSPTAQLHKKIESSTFQSALQSIQTQSVYENTDRKNSQAVQDSVAVELNFHGHLSERFMPKPTLAKPKTLVKPTNHIVARRISLSQKKNNQQLKPNSSISTENLKSKQIALSQNRALSSQSINSILPRRKFANSLVAIPQQSPLSSDQNKPLITIDKSKLKVFARSLLSTSTNKDMNLQQIIADSKQTVINGDNQIPDSEQISPKTKAIQLVAVKFQKPKMSLLTPSEVHQTKAKSFVQSQITRESPGPGALIASSNRISVVDPKPFCFPSEIITKPQQIEPHTNVKSTKAIPVSAPFQPVAQSKQVKKTPVTLSNHSNNFNLKNNVKDTPKANQATQSILQNKIKPKTQVGTPYNKQISQRVPAQLTDKNSKTMTVERLDTQNSTVTDMNLSPRSRINAKLQRKIRLNFSRLNQPPETQTENYKIGKVMGKGAFGKVNLAIHRLSGKFVALKSINKQFMTEESSKRKIMQEFNILRRTRQANIVRLYESFETAQHIVFVMEVCGGGDLLTYVRRRRKLREDVACHLFRQIILGLQYCHSKSVLHRDIKLDNILLTSQGTVKICDFGVSKLITKPKELMFEQCGTPAYIAPEVFENKGYVGYQSDVWSAGVVLYAMLYGTVPFKATNMAELHKQVVRSKPDYKEGADCVSTKALSLLQSILEKDPQKRLIPQQILEHPWMQVSQKNNKVNVFSQSEKETILQEFELYNQKKERFFQDEDGGQQIPTDPFAEQLLVSTQNSGLKNVSSRSVILAPFNSTLGDEQLAYENKKQIQDLILPRRVIKFAPKIGEINRQYEQNNNAELDNGVYHQEDDSDGGNARCDLTNQSINCNEGGLPTTNQEIKNLATSFGQQQLESQLGELMQESSEDAQLHDDEGERYEQQLEGKDNKNSEWKLLQQQMLQQPYGASLIKKKPHKGIQNDCDVSYEEVKVELIDDTGKGVQKEKDLSVQQAGFKQERLNKDVIEQIESCGYPLEFIIESLRSEQLNHVTAFYNLSTSQFEY